MSLIKTIYPHISSGILHCPQCGLQQLPSNNFEIHTDTSIILHCESCHISWFSCCICSKVRKHYIQQFQFNRHLRSKEHQHNSFSISVSHSTRNNHLISPPVTDSYNNIHSTVPSVPDHHVLLPEQANEIIIILSSCFNNCSITQADFFHAEQFERYQDSCSKRFVQKYYLHSKYIWPTSSVSRVECYIVTI